MTFKEFMNAVDKNIARMCCGMTHEDFADILWYDLFEAVGDPDDPQVYEALAEGDCIFAELYALD